MNLFIRRRLYETAGAVLGLYGVHLLIVFLFFLMWDNKGVISIWDKSLVDWLVTFWFATSTMLLLYSTYLCIFKFRYAWKHSIAIWIVLFINTKFFVFDVPAKEPVMFFGIPIILGVIGNGLWLYLGRSRNQKAY